MYASIERKKPPIRNAIIESIKPSDKPIWAPSDSELAPKTITAVTIAIDNPLYLMFLGTGIDAKSSS